MGHKYVKEDETFTTSRNGTVPKPTSADVSAGKVLKADGTLGEGGGGGGGGDIEVINITAGSGTSSNTLSFSKTPKLITSYYSHTADNWGHTLVIVWGATRAFGIGRQSGTGGLGDVYACDISYGSDGKSCTLTGHNAWAVENSTTGSGIRVVQY